MVISQVNFYFTIWIGCLTCSVEPFHQFPLVTNTITSLSTSRFHNLSANYHIYTRDSCKLGTTCQHLRSYGQLILKSMRMLTQLPHHHSLFFRFCLIGIELVLVTYSNTSSPSISPFLEEPFALSAQEGFGFFLGHPGLLLNEGHYEVWESWGKGSFLLLGWHVILSMSCLPPMWLELSLFSYIVYAVPSGWRKGCNIVPSKF